MTEIHFTHLCYHKFDLQFLDSCVGTHMLLESRVTQGEKESRSC